MYGHEIRDMLDSAVGCKCEFIDRVYGHESVDDILKRFDQSFQKNVFRQRECGRVCDPDDLLYKHRDKFFGKNGKNVLSAYKNGVKQDSMLASVYIWHEDYSEIVRDLPVFKGLNLGNSYVFDKSKPAIDPMPDESELSLRDLGQLGAIVESMEQGERQSYEFE